MTWRIPAEWRGETAFVLGGGESLTGFDASILRGRGRVVAINDAGLILAPWADLLFWSDPRWIEWNHAELHLHTGRWKACRHSAGARTPKCPPALSMRIARALAEHKVKHLAHDRLGALSRDPGRVAGACAGAGGVNAAFLAGAARIVLLGFDMRPGHWHGRHRKASRVERYPQFAAALARMARSLAAARVETLNARPAPPASAGAGLPAGTESALDCFPKVRLEDVLERVRAAA
ncbi:MAG TPA: hypothetical protein VGB88_06180 [Alphaproteobacteria bacterium]